MFLGLLVCVPGICGCATVIPGLDGDPWIIPALCCDVMELLGILGSLLALPIVYLRRETIRTRESGTSH